LRYWFKRIYFYIFISRKNISDCLFEKLEQMSYLLQYPDMYNSCTYSLVMFANVETTRRCRISHYKF